jgi:hypothetical protein
MFIENILVFKVLLKSFISVSQWAFDNLSSAYPLPSGTVNAQQNIMYPLAHDRGCWQPSVKYFLFSKVTNIF